MGATRAVLGYMAFRAYYADGRCAWPSIATISESIGYSERQVQRSLRDLEELGYVRRSPDQSWNAQR